MSKIGQECHIWLYFERKTEKSSNIGLNRFYINPFDPMCGNTAQTGVQGAEPPGVFHVDKPEIKRSEIDRGELWPSYEGSKSPNGHVVFEKNRFLVGHFFEKKS